MYVGWVMGMDASQLYLSETFVKKDFQEAEKSS